MVQSTRKRMAVFMNFLTCGEYTDFKSLGEMAGTTNENLRSRVTSAAQEKGIAPNVQKCAHRHDFRRQSRKPAQPVYTLTAITTRCRLSFLCQRLWRGLTSLLSVNASISVPPRSSFRIIPRTWEPAADRPQGHGVDGGWLRSPQVRSRIRGQTGEQICAECSNAGLAGLPDNLPASSE